MTRSSFGGGFDLIAGVLSALAFLLLVFALRLPIWLDAALAAGVYIGLRLVLSPDETPDESGEAALEQIVRLNERITNDSVHRKVEEIAETAGQIQSYFAATPKASSSYPFFQESLGATLRIVQQYVQVSRFEGRSDAVRQSVARFDELLDKIRDGFHSQLDRLINEDASGFEANVEVLKETMRPGLEGTYMPPVEGTKE